jgi:hypothetical protein
MTACERCWAEYRKRQALGEYDLVYSEVVSERDARGGCSPEEQCGDVHLLCVKIAESPPRIRCRCGKREGPLAKEESWP